MGKNKNKEKQKKSSQELTLSKEQRKALKQLVNEIEATRAANPGIPVGAIDMTHVSQLIAEHPQIASTLQEIQQRHTAIMLAKSGSPTGGHPQADVLNGGMWSTDQNNPVSVANVRLLRRWAEENEWCRAGINIRRKQVEGMKPVCTPIDPKKKYNKVVQQKAQALLTQPNEYRDSWRSLIGPVFEDLIVLDRGVLLKNMTVGREPVALYYENGGTIQIYPEWSGNPKEPRYLWVSPNGKNKKALRNDECIVIMDNDATYRYGFSPIMALQKTIEADLAATAAAANMVGIKPPPHAIQIPKASPQQIKDIAANYEAKIAGKKLLFFFGGAEAAHLFPLIFSAKDNQWMEWQVYLARKIAVLLQLSPQKLGITMDINRANGEVQQEIDEDRGLIPLLLLVEEYLTTEILGDFAPLFPDGRMNLDALNLKIVFPEITEAARKMHAKETIEMAATANPGLPSMTVNMILGLLGEEPIQGGDTLYATVQPIKWLSYDEPLDEMPQNQPPPPPVIVQPSPENDEQNDEDDDDDDETDDNNDTDEHTGPTKSAQKRVSSALRYYDRRTPGQSWHPGLNRIAHTEQQQGKKSQKKPAAPLPIQPKSPDIAHANAVLQQALQHVFADAQQHGLSALQAEQQKE